MMIQCLARRGQRFGCHPIITSAARHIIGLIAHGAAAFHIETELEAARAKTRAPIERPFGLEIVPLQTHADAVEIAPELWPACGHLAPGPALGDCFVDHRANLTSGAGANASRVSPRRAR